MASKLVGESISLLTVSLGYLCRKEIVLGPGKGVLYIEK